MPEVPDWPQHLDHEQFISALVQFLVWLHDHDQLAYPVDWRTDLTAWARRFVADTNAMIDERVNDVG